MHISENLPRQHEFVTVVPLLFRSPQADLTSVRAKSENKPFIVRELFGFLNNFLDFFLRVVKSLNNYYQSLDFHEGGLIIREEQFELAIVQ